MRTTRVWTKRQRCEEKPRIGASAHQIVDDATIAAALAAIKAMPVKPNGKIVKTYDYTDEHGKLLYQVCRLEPKDFRQRRPNGNDNWTWGRR